MRRRGAALTTAWRCIRSTGVCSRRIDGVRQLRERQGHGRSLGAADRRRHSETADGVFTRQLRALDRGRWVVAVQSAELSHRRRYGTGQRRSDPPARDLSE